MAKYTDQDGNGFYQLTEKSVGDPLTVLDANGLAINDKLWLSSKAAWLPGRCAEAIDAVAESGGAFACWRKMQDGYIYTLVNVSENEKIFGPTFDDDGLKRRVINVVGWAYQGTEAQVLERLPGEDYAYEVFGSGEGGAPSFRGGFYSDGGDDGSGEYRYEKSMSGAYTLNFYVVEDGDNEGDLVVSFDNDGGGGWMSLFVIVEFSPTLKKATS